MAEENGLPIGVNKAYIEVVGEEYATAEECAEAYQGTFDSDEDFVRQLLEDCGDIPKDLPPYIDIDWSSTANNVMQDYTKENRHYFRNL